MSHNFKLCPPVVVRLARTFLIIALLLAVGVLNTKAQNGVWTNAVTGGQWSSGANWLNGTVATGSGYTANFNQVDLTTDPTVIHPDDRQSCLWRH
jgi:hypothetical protein